MLLRNDNIARMELADLSSFNIPDIGNRHNMAVMCMINQGKTNQFGKKVTSGCLRHQNVYCCPISALSIYLFFRWHIADESVPDFKENENWYDTYFIFHFLGFRYLFVLQKRGCQPIIKASISI